jgi:hypothetical protein
MSSKRRTLTPKLAAELLATALPNRRLRQPDVRKYAADIRNDDWKGEDGQIFVWEGRMWDGAHRCHAVILTGTSIPVVIVTQEPSRTADTGLQRTFGDTMEIEGWEYSRELQATVNALGSLHGVAQTGIYTAQPRVTDENRGYTNTEKFRILDMHEDALENTKFAAYVSGKSSVALSRGWVAAVRSVAIHIEAVDEYDEFALRVATGLELSRNDPEYLLRRRYEQARAAVGQKLRVVARNALWNRAWEMNFDGQTGHVLRYGAKHFPQPPGLEEWEESTWTGVSSS